MIPFTIKIGAIPFLVKYDEPGTLPSEMSGRIDYKTQTITIEPGMGAHCEAQVLAHEIVHGMFYAIGEQDHSEAKVERLAHVLADMVTSSPSLLGYWSKVNDPRAQ